MHIAPSYIGILVTGLEHDEREIGTAASRRRGEPAAQRVTGEPLGIESDALRCLFYDFCYCLAAKATCWLAVINCTKDR